MRRKTMSRKKVDCDWRLFEFSLEELGIDTESSNDAELQRDGYAVLSGQDDELRGNHL